MEKEKLTLRPYQSEAIELVKSTNVIVNLDTGLGKTLIAVGAIDFFLSSFREKKILLVVPTVELVLQQAEYCRDNCRTIPVPRVKEVRGGDNWGEKQWRESKASFAIFVGTAQALLHAFRAHYLVVPDFSLLIFDECHNAVGQSPAACLLRDYIHPAYASQERAALGQGGAPRILGLTASFVNGAVKDLEKKRSVLEALMLATLWAPKEEDLKPFLKTKKYKEIEFDPFESELAESFVEKLISQLFGLFNKDVVSVRDVDKVIRWGLHVLSNLGLSGFMYFAAKCLVVQLEDKLRTFKASSLGWSMTEEEYRRGMDNLTAFRVLAREKPRDLMAAMGEEYMNAFPIYTCKFQKALDLLTELRLLHAKKFKGLIFLEQKSATTPMAHLINEYFGEHLSAPISRALTQSKRKSNMEDFRECRLAILVTTPALEEGIDVSNCLFVIRFDGFHTTKSHIQGSGRARFEEAEIYYFENSIDIERKKEREMRRIALDESLKLSDETIEDELTKGIHLKAQGGGVYPLVHPVSKCEVTVSNCIPLFNEYFQKVMKQSPPQDVIFMYEMVEIRRFPPEKVKTLCQVTYPSPNGFQYVRKAEVDEYWADVRFEDVVPPETIKLKPIERDKRRFVLFVMKTMLERGYVTENWKASAEAIQNTRLACPSYIVSSELTIKNSYK